MSGTAWIGVFSRTHLTCGLTVCTPSSFLRGSMLSPTLLLAAMKCGGSQCTSYCHQSLIHSTSQQWDQGNERRSANHGFQTRDNRHCILRRHLGSARV